MGTSSALMRPAVLIVDDYADTTEMYAAYLELVGYRPLKAHDGHEAIRVASSESPDIILMDLGLPGLDGVEVTRRLKRDARTRDIPVIALTAHATTHQFRHLLTVGFDGLILKPCLPDVLAEEVARILERPRASTASSQEAATQPAA